MTEKELSQLYWLNRETEQLQKDLKDLESKDLYKSPIITGMPRTNTMHDVIAEYVAEKAYIADIINLNLLRIQKERARLERYINGVKDSEIRLIMRLRHINGMTWGDIGCEIGMDRRTVSRKYYKHLKVAHNAHK